MAEGGSDHARSASIDSFRGLLLLLVVIGHFSELMDRSNFVTWFGTGFRMPVFIGLTGYLFNLERARAASFVAFVRRYYRRLILPWLVACLFHVVVTGSLGWFTPFYMIARPPFHLWFVPVMMAFVLGARACRLSVKQMFAISIPVSIAAMYLFGVGHFIIEFDWSPDRRYFTLPIYFAFGMWVARYPTPYGRPSVAFPLILIGFVWWSQLYIRPSANAEVAARLLWCIPLVALLPWIRSLPGRLPVLDGVGRDSLFFYLWHPTIFGLCGAMGLTGLPMLASSLLLLYFAWALIARIPVLCSIMGVQTIRSDMAADKGNRPIGDDMAVQTGRA